MKAALKQNTALLAADPFAGNRKSVAVPSGLTLSQIIAHAAANDNLPPHWSREYLRVYVGGVEVPRAWWPRTRLKDGQQVAIITAPQGGRGGAGKVFRTLLTVAVIALTAWVGAGALAGAFGSSLFAAGSVSAALASAGVSLIGGVITNMLAPSSGASGEAASQAFALTGARNVARPYQPMMVVLGRRRVVPPLAAATWTETVGDDVYLRGMVQWHIGPCSLSDLKIGETPITAFDGVELQHRLLPGDAYPTLYDKIVREEPLQVFLRNSDGWQRRTTQRATTKISVDVAWPTGLVETAKNGNQAATVRIQMRYRAVGAAGWINAPVGASGLLTYTEMKSVPFRRTAEWDVTEGQYEVEVQRVTTDAASSSITDQVYWVALRSYGAGRPFLLDSAAITAFRIKSSGQLNGTLDTLNGVVQMHAPLWDAEEGVFSGSGPTRNPGEILNWAALGPANARPLTSRVDTAVLGPWKERCTEKGWKCDHIVDGGTTLDQVAQIVAGAGRGFGAMWLDGKLSVALDDVQPTPVQVFSARNVRNFQGSIAFPGALHAVNVQFQDEDNGYQTATRTVFAPGFDLDNASLYETIDATGKTDAAEAYVVGWRYIAGRLLRPEIYEFETDLEGLGCRIGQRIQVAHYRMSVGISGARVRSRVLNDEGKVTALWLDEVVSISVGKSYAFRVQSGSSVSLWPILTDEGASRLITFPVPVDAAAAPRAGDHGIFGEAGKESLAAIMVGLGVKAGKDCRVAAIPYAPELQADGGDIPAWDPQITPRPMSVMPVGVHGPGLERVTLDNLIRGLNEEKDARAQGDSVPVDYAALSADLREALDQVPISKGAIDFLKGQKDRHEARLRQLSTNLGKVASALLELQIVVPQVEERSEQKIQAYVQQVTGLDVTEIAARLLTVEHAITDLDNGKAAASALAALQALINTPGTGLIAIVGQLQETVASLDESQATATLLRLVTAVRVEGKRVNNLATGLLDMQMALANLQRDQSGSLAWFQEDVTAQVTEGKEALGRAVSELGVFLKTQNAVMEASIAEERRVRATDIAAEAARTNTVFAALGALTGPGSVSASIEAVDNARVSGDAANASSITTVGSAVNKVNAGGHFSIETRAAPGDSSARAALVVSQSSGGAPNTAALFLDALSNGNTRIMLSAGQTAFFDASGNVVALFDSSGAHLAAGVFADSGILGEKVQLGEMSIPYSQKLNSSVFTNTTAQSIHEVIRIGNARALGGRWRIDGWFNARKNGSGSYNYAKWRVYLTTLGGSIGSGTLLNSGDFFVGDGEIHRAFSASIPSGAVNYNTSRDIVFCVQNENAANKPIEVYGGELTADARR